MEHVEIRTRIEPELHRRFIQILPGHGGVAWFMREAMEQFVVEAESNPSMVEMVNKAVRRIPSTT